MGKFAIFVSNAVGKVRDVLGKAFDQVDDFISDVSFILNEYGEPLTEFIYTTAVKIERAIPAHGYGSQKAVLLDMALQSAFIPMLEGLRGDKLSENAKITLTNMAKEKAAKFIAERNKTGDWKQYIDDLNALEKELSIKK